MGLLKTAGPTLAVAVLAGGLGFVAARYWQPKQAALPLSTAHDSVEGKPAPALILPDINGKPQPLAQWQGKWLLVNFWASWCAPCMEEIPLLISASQQNPQLQVLGIALDDPAEVRKTIAEKKLTYPTLVGGEDVQAAMLALGNDLGALPYSVLIDPTGVVRVTELGGLTPQKLGAWVAKYLPGK